MTRRDYRLHELSEAEFERLVVQICVRWLGEGVTPFAPGKDGGRDGKFQGKANTFPSANDPLIGHCVLQAKHAAAPNKSCSDSDFGTMLEREHLKIKRLIKEKICDHYLVFTNRKYSGGADEKLMRALNALGLGSAHIIGVERLHLALDDFNDISDRLPNRYDTLPFRFDPDDLVEVIGALHNFTQDDQISSFKSAFDFEKIKIQEKNTINGVSQEYYEQMIADSMLHFERVRQFLENPRNKELAALYHDSADDLKQKILTKRSQFGAFDEIFTFMNEHIQQKKEALKGRRRLITILLHYMYCNCDIGSKIVEGAVANADA